MKPLDQLSLLQVERRTEAIRPISEFAKVKGGWVRYIRQSLGMPLEILAERVGVTFAAIQRVEKREIEGKVTLETLHKIAKQLDCDLVYALVPRKKISEILSSQAEKKAKEILKQADVQMLLEDQQVKEDESSRLQGLASDLLKKGDIW